MLDSYYSNGVAECH